MIQKNKENKAVSTSRYINFISINDLREKELEGAFLNKNEIQALSNFDRYRIAELSKIKDEKDYHKCFSLFRIKAQLIPYEEFLQKQYFSINA